ncbi:MAG: hypothetical protein IKC11_02770 [Clostridia bacterium]|nr:hypothetical protein [Clostridia bacterium]
MFGKKRRDDTQKLFDTFMTQRIKGTPFAFSTDDVVVLTNSGVVYKDLLGSEKYKNAKNQAEGKPVSRIVEYKDLGLGSHELSKDIVLRDSLKHALLFGAIKTKYPGEKDYVGGSHTLILATNPEQLKGFIDGVVRQHILEHGINVAKKEKWDTSWLPCLFTMLTIDNNLVYESALFEHPETEQEAVAKLNSEINIITKVIPEKGEE